MTIDNKTQGRMATYEAVLMRYASTPEPCAAVLVSVRLLIHRRGYSQVLRQLQRKGVPWVAENVMAEFNELQAFVAELMAKNNVSEEEGRTVTEDMAGLLAELHSEPGQLYLSRLLHRLRLRASWWFNTPAFAKPRQDGEELH